MSSLKWWENAVIYQIYPRSFQDSNDDGIGDLKGITKRLNYLSKLGVDAIWISPFFKSPQKDFGYDVSDYYDINPDYGTLKDFEALITLAHASKKVFVTVEKILDTDFFEDELSASTCLPALYIDGISIVKNGAWPCKLPGVYEADNEEIKKYFNE